MCMHVYVHKYIYVCAYMYIHTYIHVDGYTYTYVLTYAIYVLPRNGKSEQQVRVRIKMLHFYPR